MAIIRSGQGARAATAAAVCGARLGVRASRRDVVAGARRLFTARCVGRCSFARDRAYRASVRPVRCRRRRRARRRLRRCREPPSRSVVGHGAVVTRSIRTVYAMNKFCEPGPCVDRVRESHGRGVSGRVSADAVRLRLLVLVLLCMRQVLCCNLFVLRLLGLDGAITRQENQTHACSCSLANTEVKR
ncbi:hypothetical protein EVAR_46193_1 [Eumeta japonica]|uniref:Uncharacterized protein n=1 Tax=Eumeta variegata TaxID=151549 RepID=A0A4C1WGC3_EUMVA|nr:hypothetical protein EVAR_46193_1 [Eumeta japonica]